MKTKGLIFSIEKCSLHDGPGIRTTVFLKGCPLRCVWCHNPESQSFCPELYFLYEKCTCCGRCVSVCPNNCHMIKGGEHEINRRFCNQCGKCASACPNSALEIKGEWMDVESVLEKAEQDREYYNASGGGLTVSGGEPLAHFDFTGRLLALSKQRGIHNCVETSGFVATEKIIQVANYVDIFLYDFKESDPERHLKFTGVKNDVILKNLFELDNIGTKIILRCPIIPGVNDRTSHFGEIARIAEQMKNIIEINIMPFHPMGRSKSIRIGKEYTFDCDKFVEKEEYEKWVDVIQKNTKVPVRKG